MPQFLPKGDFPCGVFDAPKDRFLPRIMVGTFGAAKHIVLAGQGLGVAPPFQLKREIDDGECVAAARTALDELELRFHLQARSNPLAGRQDLHGQRQAD
jgi:DNA-binding transcriptional LysR family regulator